MPTRPGETRKCPHCGLPNPLIIEYCLACGKKIRRKPNRRVAGERT